MPQGAFCAARAGPGHLRSGNRPRGRRSNFGPRTDALWLRLPVQAAAASGRWLLEVDYPAPNRREARLVRDGRIRRHVTMGNTLTAAGRPLRTRSHAAMRDPEPQQRHEIWLRVQTCSTRVAPVRLHPDDAFVVRESGRLLLQGPMFGVTLTPPVFAPHARLLVGASMFFVSFSGLGHQCPWDQQTVGWRR